MPDIRILVPIYLGDDDRWPMPFDAFGVINNRDVRFRQQAVGQYTQKKEHQIGIVSPLQFQPPTVIEYRQFGTAIRFVTVTIRAREEQKIGASFQLIIVAPEFQTPFKLTC